MVKKYSSIKIEKKIQISKYILSQQWRKPPNHRRVVASFVTSGALSGRGPTIGPIATFCVGQSSYALLAGVAYACVFE